MCPTLASAQGCTVSGNNGDLQTKSVTGCAASLVNDNGKVLSVNEDIKIKGPNPYVDIRSFGAKAINVNMPPAFATNDLPVSLSAASSTATLCGGLSGTNLTACKGYAANLSKGEGVYVQGAGITNSSATPTAPTVQAILPSGPMNTNLDVAGLTTGSTTYCYKVVGLRQGGGYTTASTSTCVATAPASLGNQTVNISTLALSGSTLTVVTRAAHGLTTGALINITGTSNDPNFSGWFNVSQIDSTTRFEIFSMQINTLAGAPTSATGGTVQYHNGMSIVEGTPDSTIFQYLVYGRSGGAFNYIGSMWPNNSSMAGNVTYNKFQDFGATETAPSGLTSYLPKTAPNVAMNDGLSTTIVSGGGTTTLTLGNAATNAVSGTFIVHDDVPAFNAAFAFGGVVKIPASSGFVINSFMTIPSNRFIQQAGGLTVNATVKLGNGAWAGDVGPVNTVGQFMYESLPTIVVNSGFPAFYCQSNCSMRGLTILGNTPNALLYMADAGGVGIPAGVLDRVQFSLAATNDYVGCAILLRDLNTSGGGQNIWTDVVATGGPFPQTMKSTAPLIQTSGGTGIQSKGQLFLSRRGIWFRPPTPGDISSFDSIYCQGCITPMVWGASPSPGNTSLLLTMRSMIQDTSFQPLFAALTGLIGSVTIGDTTGPGGNNPIVSGNNARIIYAFGNGASRSGGTSFANDGIFGASSNYGLEVHNIGVKIGTGYSLFAEGGQPLAPTCTLAAGTTSPVGTYAFVYTPRFANGSDGLTSYPCTITTTTGRQAVQLNWPAINGAVGYDTFNNGAAKTAFPAITTTTNSYLDAAPTLVAGQSQIQVSAGGPVGLNYQQMWTPKLTIGGEALTALPRGEQNIFLPGALTSTWTGSTWTTDKAIIVTRVQAQAKTAPVSCSPNAIVRLTNGTAPVNLTIAAAANDTGAITQNYAAGSVVTLSVQVAAAGCASSPADVNVTIQYRMQ
jgi:hypothetical protein